MKYFALLVVVLLGVTGGNLLSDWISAQMVAYRVTQAMQDAERSARSPRPPSADVTKSAASAGEQLLRRQQEAAREQRRRDRDGIRLARTCEEWRNADGQLRSETTSTEARKHCGYYDRYVNDGLLPGK